MAKKAKKKGKQTAGLELPKEIGGIKLGKDLRKAGEQLVKLAQDPVAREVALAALTAALAARKDVRKSAKKLAADTGDAAESAGKNSAWLGTALAAAAAEAGRTILDAYVSSAAEKKAAGNGKADNEDNSAKPASTDAGGGGTAH